MNPHYLTDKEFSDIYSKVPRLNVDLVIKSSEGVLFALRTIEPNNGCWHLPGGTVYKGETIAEAALRIAKKETGLTVVYAKSLGYMEFPSEMRNGVVVHTISIVIEVVRVEGELRHDEGAKELKYFASVPEKVIKEHGKFLKNNSIL